MRFNLAAAALLPSFTALTCAIALPERTSPVDVLNVAGLAESNRVSIDFTTACQGCFVGTDEGLGLNLVIPKSHGECVGPNPILNGRPLDQRWQGNEAHGKGHFPVQLLNGLGKREILISWRSLCMPGEGQVLSVRVLQVVDGGRVGDASGFTASFKQDGVPAIFRLQTKPTRFGIQRKRLESWIHPLEDQRVRIGGHELVLPSSLDTEFAKLADIKREMAILQAIQRKQEHTIIRMLKHDFKQCEGIQCMVQTAMQKAPDFAHLIAEHFSHDKVKLKKHEPFNEIAFVETLELPEASQFSGEHRPNKENSAPSAFPPFEGEHDQNPPKGDKHPHPPWGELSRLPPWADEHPSRPPHGEHPPPPPSDHHEEGPPGPPGNFHRGPPSLFRQIRHNRFLVVKAAMVFMAVVFLISLFFKFMRNHIPCLKDPRRRADRASRREERRRRCQYRRASHQHRISSWWAAHNPRRTHAAGMADYDEKRALILQQEGVLEEAMQNEIRNLQAIAQLDGAQVMPGIGHSLPHELDAGAGSSSFIRRQSYPSLDYSAPPPRYEQELDDEMIPVDGFMYTPSNTDSTPESSIVDFSPRMSVDTLQTIDTKSDTRRE